MNLLNEAGRYIGQKYGGPLAARPTVLAGSFHAVATSVLALYVLLVREDGTESNDGSVSMSRWSPWQHIGVPLSVSYFAMDTVYYCIPRKDMLILFHHAVVVFCHYPVMSSDGATLAGCGDPIWPLWISALGYTAEISTVLMNYRWYLLQTLEKQWIGFGINNILVLLSWTARVALYPYLLLVQILPRSGLYIERKQILCYFIMVLGHVIIWLLSLHWLSVMLSGGIRNLLLFSKKRPVSSKGDGGFSFGDDIGRGGTDHEGCHDRGIAKKDLKDLRDWESDTFLLRSHKKE